MKSFLTLTMLLFSCQPAGESVSGAKTFVDADACSIDYDYQFGLYQLKNAETGESSEIAVEVERAGKKITAVRIKQVGNSASAEQVVIEDIVELEEVITHQQELVELLGEAQELSAVTLEELIRVRETQGEKDNRAHRERMEKQQEIIDRLVENTKQETRSLENQARDLNEQAQNLQRARDQQQEAQRRLNITEHGLPYWTLSGTDKSTGTQQIWLHITYRPDEPNPIGIWGIDIGYTDRNGKKGTMSYDPFGKLGSLKNMKEGTIRNKYFPNVARNCGSNSGS